MTNNPTLNVRVNLGERSYDIEISTDVIQDLGSRMLDIQELTHAIIITDENVRTYADVVAKSLGPGIRQSVFEVSAGETSKSISVASQLWQQLLNDAADRKSVIIAVGGGVVGDLAGFVAATYARGIDFFQVPTTLLAQVDSSVGGKVGVNLTGAKNMVGSFWQPKYVLIDTVVLETLPHQQYRCGLAEVIKYGVILDADFFQYLESHVKQINDRDANTLRRIIAKCCRLKADVVEADEREETGLRAVLNYGHTFAHAFEAVTGYGHLLHGEAVSIGMICASRLAEKLGQIGPETTERQQKLLTAVGLPTKIPRIPHDAVVQAMHNDKKAQHGQLRLVLPTRIGHVKLVDQVDSNLVRDILGACS